MKSETEYDKFDMAFEEHFKGVQSENEVTSQMLRWLDKSDMMELAHEEARDHLNRMEEVQIDKEDVQGSFSPHNKSGSGCCRISPCPKHPVK